ncbi:MAG: hypothetical protein HUU20_11305 [Pirellulales bacterium]|nr:hypothetical protein [Pirellulales bacterium]
MSKPSPDDRFTGRREFLSMLSAAAASGLFGAAASAAPPDVPASAPGAAPQAGPAMPTIMLGKHQVSRLVAGSNPILGYSYMGKHTDQHMKEYFTTEQTVRFLQDCERSGITAHQFSTPDRAAPYIRPLREQGSKLQYICLHSERDKIQQAIDIAQPIAIVHHGGATDRLFSEGKSKRVHDYVKAVKDSGVLAGVSAHNPDCIKQVADEGWEVDLFMTCFYFVTRKTVNKDLDVSTLDMVYPFFKDDPQAMTQVIRQVKQPCLAFKILGAGRLCSSPDTVRAAFKFAFENIKPIDGVIVGMFPWYFDEIGANVEYTRQLGI